MNSQTKKQINLENNSEKEKKLTLETDSQFLALSDSDFVKMSNTEQITYLQEKYLNADIDWNYKHNVVICERSKTVVEPLISQEFFVDYYKEFEHFPVNSSQNLAKTKNPKNSKNENNPNNSSNLPHSKTQNLTQKSKKTLQKLALEGINEVEFLPIEYKERAIKYFGEIKNWCISRDLIWGHKMPIWYNLDHNPNRIFYTFLDFQENKIVLEIEQSSQISLVETNKIIKTQIRVQDCFQISSTKPKKTGNWSQEIKILDTWFSSTLWPLSTLDFPEFVQKEKQKKEINSEIEILQELLTKLN